ncbi:protein sidekick-like isoform X2 [Gordionus sp. m RMFG-2023]|uniref:protein sidekick-like isoform X2 n=1 Tax=Gordionus sp. m RMFG-2023 TaxID=3053472 RepID=UPI0031FE0710
MEDEEILISFPCLKLKIGLIIGNPPKNVQIYAGNDNLVIEGNTKVLMCDSEFSDTNMNVQWIKNGNYFNESVLSNNQIEEKFFRINSAHVSDGGVYQCLMRNDYGAALSLPLELKIGYLGNFSHTGLLRSRVLPKSVKPDAFTSTYEYIEKINGKNILDMGFDYQDDLSSKHEFSEDSYVIIRSPLIESVPEIEYIWYKDDKAITPLSNLDPIATNNYIQLEYENSPLSYSLLIINPLSKMSQGNYFCKATNPIIGISRKSRLFSIYVKDSEYSDNTIPQVIIPPNNQMLRMGEPKSNFQCVPYIKSTADDIKIRWYHNGYPILSNSHYIVSTSGIFMTILNAVISDSGNISCQITFGDGRREISQSSQLKIIEKPIVLGKTFRQIDINYDANFSLSCEVDLRRSSPVISWFHNGKPLKSSKYIHILDKDLVIKNFQFINDGLYQCFAENYADATSQNFWARVSDYPPILLSRLQNSSSVLSTNISLNCSFISRPRAKIIWIENGKIILEEKSVIVYTIPNGGLPYTNVSCLIANYLGSVKSTAIIKLIAKTKIIRSDRKILKVIIGEGVSIPCLIQHDSSIPIYIEWFKSNTRLVKANIFQNNLSNMQKFDTTSTRYNLRYGENDYSLNFINSRNTDKGVYSCKVSSSAGDDERNISLEIMELPFPPLDVRATLVKPIKDGKIKINWISNFDGNSPISHYIIQYKRPRLKECCWLYHSKFLSNSSELTIQDLPSDSAYIFRLKALNEIGEGAWSSPSNNITVPIAEPDIIPKNIHGASSGSNWIYISWQISTEELLKDRILGYIINYKLAGFKNDHSWLQENLARSSVTSFNLTNLIPWKEYEIKLAVYNKAGTGIPAEPIKVWTNQGVPEIAPVIEKVVVLNSTACSVSWISPDPQLINGIIVGYKFRFYEGVNLGTAFRTVTHVITNVKDSRSAYFSSLQTLAIGGLQKYSFYHIDMNCFTETGDGPYSPLPIKFRTFQDVPSKVRKISITNIMTSSATLSWLNPMRINGILKGYNIQYYPRNHNNSSQHEIKEIFVDAETETLKLSDLLYSIEYIVNISASTEVGRGPVQSIIFVSGFRPTIPGQPKILNVQNNSTRANISLEFGSDGNSKLLSLVIMAKYKYDDSYIQNLSWFKIDEIFMDNNKMTNENINITISLNPNTYYQLAVKVKNMIGESDISQPSNMFKTGLYYPTVSPKIIGNRCYRNRTCIVVWIPLKYSEWNGPPYAYDINIYNTIGKANNTYSVENYLATYYKFTDLMPFTKYTVIIVSRNTHYKHDNGSRIILNTFPHKPLAIPKIVSINSTTTTAMIYFEKNWENSYDLIDYLSVKILLNSNIYLEKIYAINTLNQSYILILGLEPLNSYSNILTYRNMMGLGIPSVPSYFKMDKSTPLLPQYMQFKLINNRFLLNWAPPSHSVLDDLIYQISYKLNTSKHWTNTVYTEKPNVTQLMISSISPNLIYDFRIRAQNEKGWGDFLTTQAFIPINNTNMFEPIGEENCTFKVISYKSDARMVTVTWKDPYQNTPFPTRYYFLTYQKMGRDYEFNRPKNIEWSDANNLIISAKEFYHLIKNLDPSSTYLFKMKAANDINEIWLKNGKNNDDFILTYRSPDLAPSRSATILDIKIIEKQNVKINWKPIPASTWNSKFIYYSILFAKITDHTYLTDVDLITMEHKYKEGLKAFKNINVQENPKNEYVIRNLIQEYGTGVYSFHAVAYNNIGYSNISNPILMFLGETPSSMPPVPKVITKNSTLLVLEPYYDNLNGSYWLTIYSLKLRFREAEKDVYQYLDVYCSTCLGVEQFHETKSITITNLKPFTTYFIDISYQNLNGVGAYSYPGIRITTSETKSSQPSNIRLKDITMSSVRLLWDPPKAPNGKILRYKIEYISNNFKVEKIIDIHKPRSVVINGLIPYAEFNFGIAAENSVGLGIFGYTKIYIGPQQNSPQTPLKVDLYHNSGEKHLTLTWSLSNLEYDIPIEGYYVEAFTQTDDNITTWQNMFTIHENDTTYFQIPIQSLAIGRNYSFRMISFNSHGVSNYSRSTHWMNITPQMIREIKNKSIFYNKSWFLIIIALCSSIVIVLLVSYLCCKSKDIEFQKKVVNDHNGLGLGVNSILNLTSDHIDPRHGQESYLGKPADINDNSDYQIRSQINRIQGNTVSSNRSRRNINGSKRGKKSLNDKSHNYSDYNVNELHNIEGVIYPIEYDNSDTQRSTLQKPIYSQNFGKKVSENSKLGTFSRNDNPSRKQGVDNYGYGIDYNTLSSAMSINEKPLDIQSYTLQKNQYEDLNNDSDIQSSLVSHYTTSHYNRENMVLNRDQTTHSKKSKRHPKPIQNTLSKESRNPYGSVTDSISTFASPQKFKNDISNQARFGKKNSNKFDLMVPGTRAPLPPMNSFI